MGQVRSVRVHQIVEEEQARLGAVRKESVEHP